MKAITTQNIDGYDIVTRITSADGFIDPERTKKIVAVEIQKEQVWKDIEVIKKQMAVYAQQAIQALKHSRKAKTKQDIDKFYSEFLARREQMKELEDELKPLAVKLKAKQIELMLEHALYFTPAPNEKIIDDEYASEYEDLMIEAITEGKLVDKNLKKIANNKGKKFWKKEVDKWKMTDINKIGIDPPNNSIEECDLTPEQSEEIAEQIEKDRIAALSPTEKNAEKNNALQAALGQAAMMKSEYEIQGNPDALQLSQDWYDNECLAIEAKYQ